MIGKSRVINLYNAQGTITFSARGTSAAICCFTRYFQPSKQHFQQSRHCHSVNLHTPVCPSLLRIWSEAPDASVHVGHRPRITTPRSHSDPGEGSGVEVYEVDRQGELVSTASTEC